MKMLKNEVRNAALDEDDGDDSHMLLGFDESTTSFYGENKSCAEVNNGTPNATIYFRWTPESTKMMLTVRFDMDRLFSQRVRQKKDLWNEVASEMGRLGGYVITGEVCDLKFRNMLQTYKKNRLKDMRGMQDLIVWEYYAFFKEATLRNSNENNNSDHLIPSLLCESVCAEDSPQEASQHYEEELTKAPTKRSARLKRARAVSPIPPTDNSCEEQDSLLIQLKSKPTQSPKPQTATPIPSPPQKQPSAPITTPTDVAAANASVLMPPPIPNWLNPNELSECQIFGQSVGLQVANVRDSYSRALLKLKIQELIFLAGTGKLPDKYTFSYD